MTPTRFTAALISAVSIIALTACGGPTEAPGKALGVDAAPVMLEQPPAGQLPSGVTPTAYRLDILTNPAAEEFAGTVEIDIKLDAPHARIWLHALGPNVTDAIARLADGTEIPASFAADQAEGGVSSLDFDSPVPAGNATLVLDYVAPYNFALAGLYKSTQADRPYLATQMEPIDARRMFPGFDEPRFKTPWTLTVTAPEGLEVITNAPLVKSAAADNGMVRHEFGTTRPLQTYLVALAVGPYDSMLGADIPADNGRADPIPLRGFAPFGKSEKLKTALEATDDMLLWQEDYFGTPYPYGKLDLIAVPDFAYGAMENAGAIIYRESALLIDERTSLGQKRGILTTHAHELGHQWFGNLVTPKWWNDIWLNESFATWISYKTMHAYDPEGGWDLRPIRAGQFAMGADSLKASRQIRNPISRNADILDAFDGITYSKGGSVLNMFEAYLGEDEFREGIRLHMTRFSDGVADVDDFMQSLADGSGKPEVVDSFKSFILQPGIPMLDVTVECRDTGGGMIRVTQSRYAPLGSQIDTKASSWSVPFAARVDGPGGTEIVRKMLTDKTTEIALNGECPISVMPNAGGSGYWRYSTDPDNAAAIAANYAELSDGEQLAYVDSLRAGFSAGQVNASDLLAGLAASTNGSSDAIIQPLGAISSMHAMLDEEGRVALGKWVQVTYEPTLKALEAKPAKSLTDRERLLKNALYDLVIDRGNRPAERKKLIDGAKTYVGVSGAANPGALTAAQLGSAMSLAAQDGGQDFFETAVEYAAASENQSERRAILGNLARNGGASDVANLMKRAMGNGFSGNDMYSVMMNSMSNEDELETVWPIFRASFDNVVRQIPEIRKPQIARATGAFCSAEGAAEAREFFTSKASAISGYERSLATGEETALLCGALREAKAAEVKAALMD